MELDDQLASLREAGASEEVIEIVSGLMTVVRDEAYNLGYDDGHDEGYDLGYDICLEGVGGMKNY